MKAVIQERYGTPDDLVVRDAPAPEPGPGQVRVRVKASSVHADVWHVVTGRPYVLRLMGAGLLRPKQPIPGTDVAGKIDELGEGAAGWSVGDRVYGEVAGRLQWQHAGAWAEYIAVDADALWPIPDEVDFEQAASVPTAALIAWLNLFGEGREPLGPDQVAVINGAGGHLGAMVVSICKAWGARVVAVDHGDKRSYLEQLGADRFVDYTTTDMIADLVERGERADLIFDVASTIAFPGCRAALTPETGRYVRIGHDHYGSIGRRWLGAIPDFLWLLVLSFFYDGLPSLAPTPDNAAAMEQATVMLEAGQIAPVVDRTFSLDEAPEALRYLQSGRATGAIVIKP